MKATRSGAQVPLPPRKPLDIPKPERERVSQGWTAPLPRPNPRREEQGEGTMMPLDPGALGGATVDAVKQLAPMGVSGVDPLQLLDGVKDGKATLTIPLQPGRYQMKGISYEVKPGTVARVQVDVKDGRVMPAVDQHGRPTGRGTMVDIHPPLDLPLWVTGNGAYVQDKGGAQAAFKADLGGFFDLKLQKLESTKLPDVVKAFSAANPNDKVANFPKGMLRTDEMAFDAQVSMKDNVVSAGAAKIDLAPGSRVTLNGTARRATLDAQVNLDGATLRQGGTDLKLGPGSARVRADYSTQADGTMKLSTAVTGVNARIERASLERRRSANDADPDRIELGNATLTNGSFTMDATLASTPGSAVPQVKSSTVRLHGETEGSLMSAKLTVKDSQDDAQLKLGPGRFKGSLDVTPAGAKVDGSITNTTLDVRDLQTRNQNARLGIHHGHFEGDLKLRSDTTAGEFDLQMQARKVDVRIDGYQGRKGDKVVDFERIDVTGAGDIHINNQTGTEITGDMLVRGELNDLVIGNQLDLGKGSVIDGRATSFHAGGERGFELKGTASLDAAVEKFDVAGPSMSASGAGRLRGDTEFEFSKGDVSLVVKKARADVTLSDGKIGTAQSSLGLDVAAGSTAKLEVDEARFGTASAEGLTGDVKLGKGSVIDATLDEGHVTVSGRRIELEKGANAQFTFESLEAGSSGPPSLKGALSLQTGVSTGDLSGLSLSGLQLAQVGNVKGRVKLDVPNVTLAADGKVTYQNAKVALDARVGDLKAGVARAPPLSARPAGVLTEEQVKAASAVEIAGVSKVDRPSAYDPLEAVRRVQNGTVELEIPVEGRLGEGYRGSADFAKGTTMKVQLKVRDGKVVPSETKATFTKPGDAALWATVKGAYFDKDNTLRLDIGWGPDVALPGMEKLPTDIDALVTRLQSQRRGGSAPLKTDALKFEQAKVSIEDAQFKPGKLNVPGGWIDVGPSTKLSVKGTMQAATLSGKVELNSVDITQGGVALKGSNGSADLNVSWRDGVATTTLDKLNLETEYAVTKRPNGDYLKLAKGRVQNGKLSMQVPFDARALTAQVPSSAALDVEQFTGTVEGARLSTVANGKRTQLEIGRAQVDGRVRIDNERIEVVGTVKDADILARGLSTGGAQGKMEIESARMVGSGRVDFSSQRGLEMEADVSAMELKAKAAGAGQTANRTRITGAGQVAWSSTKGLSLNGELHVEAELSGEVQTRAPQQRATEQRQKAQRIVVHRDVRA